MRKINVIIPSYRPNNYLKELLENLFKQSLDKCFFKVTIILNGDKIGFYDFCESIVHEYNNKGMSVDFYYIEESGVSNARNYGLERCDEEYIVFLDDDDLISSNFLQGELNMIDSKNKVIIQPNFMKFSDDQNHLIESSLDYIGQKFKELKGQKYNTFLFRSFFSNVSGKMFRRCEIADNRFKKKVSIGEDALFMFPLSTYCKIMLSDENVYYYRRIRFNSSMRKKRKFIELIRIYGKNIILYFKMYIVQFYKYNFLFFVSRIVASIKVFLKQITN